MRTNLFSFIAASIALATGCIHETPLAVDEGGGASDLPAAVTGAATGATTTAGTGAVTGKPTYEGTGAVTGKPTYEGTGAVTGMPIYEGTGANNGSGGVPSSGTSTTGGFGGTRTFPSGGTGGFPSETGTGACFGGVGSTTTPECATICEPQNASYFGTCENSPLYHWNGRACEQKAGCWCEGSDCASGFATQEACESAYSICNGREARCAPQDALPFGTCDSTMVFFWDGTVCKQWVKGCSCTGADCGNGYATLAACEFDRSQCVPTPVPCTGHAGECLPSEYCAYEADGALCGQLDVPARCLPRPTVCDTNAFPVCGCDGRTYLSSCEAARAGSGVLANGECPTYPD